MNDKWQELIVAWLNDYGEVGRSKKWNAEYSFVPIPRRRELFKYLIQMAIDSGETKESFVPSVKVAICKSCFPPEDVDHDKKNRARGLQAARTDLEHVLDKFFREKKEVILPEKVADIPSPTQDKSFEEYDPAIHKSPFKDLDRSLFKDIPEPNVIIDKEAAKLLGFDDE